MPTAAASTDNHRSTRPRGRVRLDLSFLVAGTLLLGLALASVAAGEIGRQRAVAEFARTWTSMPAWPPGAGIQATTPAPGRREPRPIDASTLAPTANAHTAIALLRIPRLDIQVPVLSDTSRSSLHRGAGWIQGTAGPDAAGNFAVAGHRDSHFRPLRKIVQGDVLEVRTRSRLRRYRVTRLDIVDPADTTVLLPGPQDLLTMVTCHPFDFIGPAPRRFIVRAEALP